MQGTPRTHCVLYSQRVHAAIMQHSWDLSAVSPQEQGTPREVLCAL